jgi:hypothetical protein
MRNQDKIEKERHELQKEKSDVHVTILFAKLLKISKKKYRSENDLLEIQKIEGLFESAIWD